jgi:hypothetical protein
VDLKRILIRETKAGEYLEKKSGGVPRNRGSSPPLPIFFGQTNGLLREQGDTKGNNSNGMNRMTKTERSEQEWCEQVLRRVESKLWEDA